MNLKPEAFRRAGGVNDVLNRVMIWLNLDDATSLPIWIVIWDNIIHWVIGVKNHSYLLNIFIAILIMMPLVLERLIQELPLLIIFVHEYVCL